MTARAAAAIVVGAVAVAALCSAWAALERSTIPIALDGRVDRVVMRHGKLGGSDDVWQLWFDGGRRLSVDRRTAALVPEGSVVEKDAWSTDLLVDGVAVPLAPSSDLVRISILGVVAVAVAAWVVRPAWRRAPPGERSW